MNKKTGLILAILLGIVSILLVKTGIELWSLGTDVDGDGIGVYFLGFEINDSVPEASIPTYAIGFFVASVVSLLVGGGIAANYLIKGKLREDIQK
ncbi:hypothetical protein [Fredinandcohnia sp. 179-A 10B2 NHS]|uniref:hypothetical protein n=1 Tax=Fredinandcohnia sp. 179-A 10B2 NHS TaxID=3235176 RepID=UPI0039A2144C